MKKLLTLTLAVSVAVSVLAGCSKPKQEPIAPANNTPAGPVNLTYWTPLSGGDAEFMMNMTKTFNEKNPGIKVEMLSFDGNEYYTKLRTAMVSKQVPDVAIAHTSRLAELVPTGMVENLDTLSKQAGIDWSKFSETILKATVIDGKHVAVPLDTHATVLFYNKKILKEAGLLDANGLPAMGTGMEGFLNFLKQVKAKVPADVMPFSTTSNGNQPYWGWWALYSQMGGKLLTADGKKADFNNEKGKKALQVLADLIYKDAVWPKGIKNGNEIFAAGKGAVQFNGVWVTGTYEKTSGLEFGVMPIPQFYDKKATWGDSHTLILPVQAKKDENKQVAAAKFANWLADNGAMWAKAGHVPSKPDVVQTAEFKSLPYRGGYVDVANQISYLPYSDKIIGIADVLKAQFNLVMNGQATVDDVLKKAEEEVNKLLAN